MENENLVAYRKLEITLNSASNLPNIRSFLKMKVYAMVRIGKIFETTKQTPTDMNGGTNPIWNYDTEFLISETNVQQAAGLKVIIKFYCQRSIRKDKCIGKVSISINELFNTRRNGTNRSFSLDNENGVVNLSYRFGDVINGRARDWQQFIMTEAKRLWRLGGPVLLQTAVITTAGILVPA